MIALNTFNPASGDITDYASTKTGIGGAAAEHIAYFAPTLLQWNPNNDQNVFFRTSKQAFTAPQAGGLSSTTLLLGLATIAGLALLLSRRS